MVRCTTCALLIREPLQDFFASVGGQEQAEAYEHMIYMDLKRNLPEVIALYCYGQEPQFTSQMGTQLEAGLCEIHELISEEHDCPYYQIKTHRVSLEESIKIYERRKCEMSKPAPIQIHGGTFVQSQIGTYASTYNAYAEALNVDSFSSERERSLKQALLALRKGIEEDLTLSPTLREAAAMDLAQFSEEIAKSSTQRSEETEKFFWKRFMEVANCSASLVALASAVAGLAGLA